MSQRVVTVDYTNGKTVVYNNVLEVISSDNSSSVLLKKDGGALILIPLHSFISMGIENQ